MATRAPALASDSAICLPIPRDAPVTSVTLLSRLIDIMSAFSQCGDDDNDIDPNAQYMTHVRKRPARISIMADDTIAVAVTGRWE